MAKKKNKVGRPKIYNVDTEKLYKLAQIGCPVRECANILGCTEDLITNKYSDIYTKGRENLRERLRMRQIRAALKGNVVMLIWLGKQYLDQSDKKDVNLGGGVRIIKDDLPKNG